MKRGDPIKYRGMAGDVYDAEVAVVRQDGSLDIDVIASSRARVPLGRIALAANEGQSERGEAFIPASAFV